ncbi:MAG: phage major capsid protein, partial [Acetivibrio ethanolgignens]
MNKQRNIAKNRETLQMRADLKTYDEQRAEAVEEMKELTKSAEEQQRAFTPEEETKFDELEKRVQDIDAAVEKIERAKSLELTKKGSGSSETEEELEERAFESYIRGKISERSDGNLTFGENG